MFLFDELPGLDWIPQADVYRTPTGWVVKLDLAGVRREDVTVVARPSEIVVSGVRRDQFVERGYRHHTMEISYSRFERTIRMPCRADVAAIRTEYSDGMLVIALEMTDHEEP
ncbi:MAG: Hsp20/alpha crystallin family protein [Vicinamibacteria bacterium]